MKTTILLFLALLVFVCPAALSQNDATRTRSYIDTIYATAVKIPVPKVSRRAPMVNVLNLGKVGGGSGILYVGTITKVQGRTSATVYYDTTYTPAAGWMGCTVLWDNTYQFNIENCAADTLYLRSTDSVKVHISIQ